MTEVEKLQKHIDSLSKQIDFLNKKVDLLHMGAKQLSDNARGCANISLVTRWNALLFDYDEEMQARHQLRCALERRRSMRDV